MTPDDWADLVADVWRSAHWSDRLAVAMGAVAWAALILAVLAS